MNNTQNSKPHVGMIAAICTDSNVVSKECAIPVLLILMNYLRIVVVILDCWWKNTKPYLVSYQGRPHLTHYIPTKVHPFEYITTHSRSLLSGSCSLNKQTAKDSYPLPLPDEVQDHLANAAVFSTLDLHSGYWQLPVAEVDQPKITFCPGPGDGPLPVLSHAV